MTKTRRSPCMGIVWLGILLFCLAVWVVIMAAIGGVLPAHGGEYENQEQTVPYNYEGYSGYCDPCPEKVLRYNPMKPPGSKDSWTYEKPRAPLKYNPFNQEWTYEK